MYDVHERSIPYKREELSGVNFVKKLLRYILMYDLQENWSIPYKREELLGVCLEASTRLAKDGLLEQNDACRIEF